MYVYVVHRMLLTVAASRYIDFGEQEGRMVSLGGLGGEPGADFKGWKDT